MIHLDAVTSLILGLSSLLAGITGLVKVVRLWRQAQDNWRRVRMARTVAELRSRSRLQDLLVEDRERRLRICEEAVAAYEGSRWAWESR